MNPRSPETNRQTYREVANSGDVDAQYCLACHYDFVPPKNRRAAIHWYMKAAQQGHPEAQNLLGESYRDGWNVEKNRKIANSWFKKAAAQGQPDRWRLGGDVIG